MADPLSITTGILALITAVGKTSIVVTDFVKTCREARGDLLGVSQELSTLKQILEWLRDDTDETKQSAIPESLTAQIIPIVTDCDRVLKKIDNVVKGHASTLGPTKWALGGKKDIGSLREALSAHRGALSVTLETLTIVLARDIKNDTAAIRGDTAGLKLGQEQILARIEELQAQLPQSIRDGSDTAYIIQRYLDGLTSYAETVGNLEIEWSDNDSISMSKNQSLASGSSGDGHASVHSRSELAEEEEDSHGLHDIKPFDVHDEVHTTFKQTLSPEGRAMVLLPREESRHASLTMPSPAVPYTTERGLEGSLNAIHEHSTSVDAGKIGVIVSKSTAQVPYPPDTSHDTGRLLPSSQNPAQIHPQPNHVDGQAKQMATTIDILSQGKKRLTLPTNRGEWMFRKLLGRGHQSIVRVIRNKSDRRQEAACKIINRFVDRKIVTDKMEQVRQTKVIDARTRRSISTLLLFDHPYICGAMDVVRTKDHWYLLLEYVKGGQLQDRGRLKEKQARKFTRDIVSALEYLHSNNIAHLSLSRRNILINKAGDIKLIGFGHGAAFSSRNFFTQFRAEGDGRSYLYGKPYGGPEADIWALGTLIYEMLTGQRPKFSTYSNDSLVWPSQIEEGSDARDLISRILAHDSRQRASSLGEIKHHPWLLSGYESIPESFVPYREPLSLPLDDRVIKSMAGLDLGLILGPRETFKSRLTAVIESNEYKKYIPNRKLHAPPAEKNKSVFSFYKRRSAVPPVTLREYEAEPSPQLDPLVSIYHLVREKHARDPTYQFPRLGSQSQPEQTAARRPARSKNGCLTCRRRKVRCDEQRPRCSHCERLNLECKWRPPFTPTTQRRFMGIDPTPVAMTNGMSHGLVHSSPEDARDSPGMQNWLQNPGAVDQLFDYASFMWDAGDVLGQLSPERAQTSIGPGSDCMNPWTASIIDQTATFNANASSTSTTELRLKDPSRINQPGEASSTRSSRPSLPPAPAQLAEDRHLIDYFVRTVVPPILAEVETQKRWSSMRQMLISMSNASSMVRSAILAFSNLLLHRQEAPWLAYPQHHYEHALTELIATGDLEAVTSHTVLREHLLATLFFLSYVDILEDRVKNAHVNLKRAYEIFRQGDKRGFRPVEIRLLSWIRLLDARAVSAGGEGLFLMDNAEHLLVQPSPASVEEVDHEGGGGGGTDDVRESDIEDVLFQVLYHPGIVFFQKVQSFMGRISKIDPWHRSRGTVEDETEVMNIASKILKDLKTLHDDRPALMDHAVAGRLTAPHVSETLAFSITRAFRTYLSNYHASKVHLHRVAYKHLPLTRETTEALTQIRHLTRLMVEGLDHEAALPVSQLWPLLMLGSEEKDLVEREWIKEQILRMEKVATNARITAQVLEEVQARQDTSGARVDIRSVMHAIFDSCFAIM